MNSSNTHRGFTLVELITVMVIVGILAVAVLPRFFTVSDFEDRGSADQVKSLLRFAQKTAIAQHQNISVAISGGAASSDCTTTLTATSPHLTCQVKSAITAGAGTHTFDALGRPVPNAQATITVGSTTFIIELETGYVH
ncbi:MAG: prepilin-type N-terminal cleavage/methylation domain-containing protein [Gallionella sp.]|nr:prepilin-type N-terminal cleavage/methylation domain-containing protein [Gallionella sp.]